MRYKDQTDTPAAARRQPVRKGTRSCWDCKRRKVRCVFASALDAACTNCRRRGATCAGQELPEAAAPPREQQMGDRVARVEEMVQHLSRQVGALAEAVAGSERRAGNDETPLAGDLHDTPHETSNHFDESLQLDAGLVQIGNGWEFTEDAWPGHDASSAYRQVPSPPRDTSSVTQQLLAAFPSPKDTDTLCRMTCSHKYYFHLADSTSFGALEQQGLTPLVMPPSSAELMDPAVHPVVLARTMILLCSFLQVGPEHAQQLDQEPDAIITRLLDAVSGLVTSNDKFNDSIEFLECLIYESVFYKSRGDLHRAWRVMRRALVVAQLMGLHRPRPPPVRSLDSSSCRTEPRFVWARILYLDRYLCLLLALPPGATQAECFPETSPAVDGPLDRLGRVHVVLASRILERNERTLPAGEDAAITREIDAELVKAGSLMPEAFWAVPDFTGVQAGSEAEFWQMARISAQIFYYSLVMQLHLPHLIQFDDGNDANANDNNNNAGPKKDYSRIACVNASREILSRFLTHHDFRQTGTCHRALGFIALTASVALILGHMDGQLHRGGANVFAHQRRSDRAMVGRVLEAVGTEVVSRGGFLDDRDFASLRALLRVDEDVSRGAVYALRSCHSAERGSPCVIDARWQDVAEVAISIPQFSHITVHRQQVTGKKHGRSEHGPDTLSLVDLDVDMHQFLELMSDPRSSEGLEDVQLTDVIEATAFGRKDFQTMLGTEDWA